MGKPENFIGTQYQGPQYLSTLTYRKCYKIVTTVQNFVRKLLQNLRLTTVIKTKQCFFREALL